MTSGDPASGERRFRKLVAAHPALGPAQTGLAYALLREGRTEAAGGMFRDVLARRPDYVPALVGSASEALRGGRVEEALAALRRAAALDSVNETVRRRLGEVRVQVTERRVSAARAAVAAGAPDRAAGEYAAALEAAPEATDIRLALADLLVQQGDRGRAVSVLQAAPAEDRDVLLRLGDVLDAMGEHTQAIEVYRRVLARDASDRAALEGARRAREAIELAQMPDEYRRIPQAPSITRADLAALVMAKVTALSRVAAGAPKVAVDISGSWARDAIIRALAFDILDVYPNHTFQPAAMVRRGDLARVVQRVLDLVNYPTAKMANPTDMSPNNLFRYPAARVVGAGLMDLDENDAFEPWRPVSGREAIDVIEGLVRLIGP